MSRRAIMVEIERLVRSTIEVRNENGPVLGAHGLVLAQIGKVRADGRSDSPLVHVTFEHANEQSPRGGAGVIASIIEMIRTATGLECPVAMLLWEDWYYAPLADRDALCIAVHLADDTRWLSVYDVRSDGTVATRPSARLDHTLDLRTVPADLPEHMLALNEALKNEMRRRAGCHPGRAP